ncbi:MAG: DUF1844 domain-containing protein [Thermodesulfobacteriota bacterium]|jgi:hypothetical protein|nr:MAG: DUF1844 domain-containing protein [Thermodesulfobacteriota bacterium]
MTEEKKEESFTVSDKRRFVVDDSGGVKSEGDVGAKEKKEAPVGSEPSREKQENKLFEGTPLPDIDFSTFIFSLSSNVILHLGLMENPYTKTIDKNFPLAKQTIDIISMLKDKTKGNLSDEEENLITHLLTELRFKYVNEVKKQ